MSKPEKLRLVRGLIVLACCSPACTTQFKSAPDAGSATMHSPINGTTTPGSSGSGGASSTPVGAGAAGSNGMGQAGSGGSNAGASGSGGHSAASASGGTSGAAGTMGSAGNAGNTGGSGGGMAPDMVKCPDTVLPPGDSTGMVMVSGTPRVYYMHVPANYTGQMPVPLVTDWHPILTNASFEQGNSGYQAKADTEGFIVAWPEGIDNAWNVGPCCTTSRDVDDVGFARALIAQIESQACIDPKRVYAVGYSMGGGMSYKLACDAADLIAAVAPAAFELMEQNEWACNPKRPITVIAFNGTADFIVPYTGGASNPPNGLAVTNHFLGAEGTFMKWAELDGCTGMPESSGGDCSTYKQCKDGVEVTSCIKQGGGHDTGDPNVAWDTLKRFMLP